jgi:6-phosphogluconate dehydrogenase
MADHDGLIDDLRQALYASKIVAYAQGFAQLAAASEEHDWSLDLAGVAKIWRGGCIIRAGLLERIRAAFDTAPDLENLVLADDVTAALEEAQAPWRRVVAAGVTRGVPVPAMAAALTWYDGVRRERLPANLIQAQRDFFGAHTYRRLDRDGSFHTDWPGDRIERPID